MSLSLELASQTQTLNRLGLDTYGLPDRRRRQPPPPARTCAVGSRVDTSVRAGSLTCCPSYAPNPGQHSGQRPPRRLHPSDGSELPLLSCRVPSFCFRLYCFSAALTCACSGRRPWRRLLLFWRTSPSAAPVKASRANAFSPIHLYWPVSAPRLSTTLLCASEPPNIAMAFVTPITPLPLSSVTLYRFPTTPAHRSGTPLIGVARLPRACLPPPSSSAPASGLSSSPSLSTAFLPNITEETWHWPGHGTISYLEAKPPSPSDTVILFVHGFGTSKRDFLRNIPAVARAGHRVLAVDLLGLGLSSPSSAAIASTISVAKWREQVAAFLAANVPPSARVYVVGNSLGGLLAAALASRPGPRGPVRGALLLNPAPFWLTLPRNAVSRALLRLFWARLTRPDGAVVEETLRLVYADPARVRPGMVTDILDSAAREFGREVFEAVLTEGADGGEGEGEEDMEFDARVAQAFGTEGVPLAIVYGKEDPWVVPLFGLRLKQLVPGCSYFELSPCGHQAQIEAPEAVNEILTKWVAHVEEGAGVGVEHVGNDLGLSGKVFDGVSVMLRDEKARGLFERFAGASNYAAVFVAAYASTFFRDVE